MTCQKKYYNLYFDLLILISNFNLPSEDLNRNFIHSISLDDSLRRENLVVNYDPDLDLDYLDWWSKYFTSVASENENKKKSSDKEDTSEEEADLEMTVPRKKRRERRGSFVSLKQKISMQNEIKRKNTDRKQIQKIQVFDCELEKKFTLNETIDRFSLIIGKNRPVVQQDGIQCLFKGKFMLYDEKNLSEDVAQYLSMNGGFLKRMPPNLPVKLKVHLYIVKVSIVNPIHLIGKFEPFICIQNGDNQIEEKFKNDSIEPLIGKINDRLLRSLSLNRAKE
ncbi:otoferlin-like isoform X2 [Brachionus plicatilis]|uniref:Otoferlin-like isoform X2 n=1 Tax=Brachionus plicatilis TaxID=10195 RepID=A0A3M7PAI8_BRAPC|nr:otoferlin-like isoform X2 [Brachionus plicatilis]